MAKVHPYVNFKGTCEEAFNFYKSIFGGEFSYIGRYKDIPEGHQHNPEDGEKIMHISLPLDNNTMLMGSDFPKEIENQFVEGTNISLTVTPDSEEEAYRIFNALAAGGRVNMPQEKTFWGSLFGMLTDKFGINWMVDYALEKQEA